MNRTLLGRFGFAVPLALLMAAGCAQQGVDDGSGGTQGSGSGGTSQGQTGGSSGSLGGAQGSLGGHGAGGTTATGSGGQTTGGTGGTTATGSGGQTAGGTGGTTATGSGGQTAGGTGGASGGLGGSGAGGLTGAGGGTIDTTTFIPGLDGYYWEVTPSGNTSLSGTNYPFGSPSGGCPTGATWDTTGYINTKPSLNIKGTTGQKYTVNINVRGVVGTRCYTGGTPASTATPTATGQNNTWYAGGKQFNDSIWNTMEIRVTPKVAGQANQTNTAYDVYYANSFPNVSNWCQKEATYEARYNASFPVMGGGTVTFVIHDSNCRTLGNCGPVESQTSCDTTASRVIDMSGLNPAPTGFTQPRVASLGGTSYEVQWVWIDVTSVTSP
jgi:hypothetical protein